MSYANERIKQEVIALLDEISEEDQKKVEIFIAGMKVCNNILEEKAIINSEKNYKENKKWNATKFLNCFPFYYL